MTEGHTHDMPCIHIGWPKTGTTTLQRHFFDKHPGIENLGRPYRDLRLAAMSRHIVHDDEADFDGPACRATFGELIAPRLGGRKAVLLSDELFPHYQGADRALIAQRLRSIFGNSKIIITIRHQLDLVASFYIHSCKPGKFYNVEEWLRRHKNDYLPTLKFFDLAKIYADLFGFENVGVFLFEDMRRDPAKFSRNIASFIGVDQDIGAHLLEGEHEHLRKSERMVHYARFRTIFLPHVELSRFVPNFAREACRRVLAQGSRATAEISEGWQAYLRDLYAPSNRNLAQSFGLALAEYGYPL